MESETTLRRWLVVSLGLWLFICASAGVWQFLHARNQARAGEEAALRVTARRLAWNLAESAHDQIDTELQASLQGWDGLDALLKKDVSPSLVSDPQAMIGAEIGEDVGPLIFEQGPINWLIQSEGELRVSVDLLFRAKDGQFHSLKVSRPAADFSFWVWGSLAPWGLLTLVGCVLLYYVIKLPNQQTILANQRLLQWATGLNTQVEGGPRELNSAVPIHLPESFGQLEDTLEKSSELLRAKMQRLYEELFRTTRVLNSMLEGVVAVDRKLRILAANPAARDLLAMSAEPTPGRSLVELVRFPKLTAMVEQALKNQKTVEGDVEVGGTNRRFLRIRLLPLPGDNEPVGVLITLSDETRLRRLENLRREFVANVSHELKTPLAAIKAYAETLLLGALEDQGKNVQFVERISQQADRLDRLIRDMLQLARVQSGNLQMSSQEFLAETVLASCIESHRVIGEGKGVAVRMEPIASDLYITGDYEAFITIMNNLISNAVRYTDAGGEVKVSVVAEDPWICIRVTDTGIGIPEEDHERIFERFYRVEKARTSERGGTGLGLAIVKHLVRAMGGTIRLESQLGIGSTFEVRLRGVSRGESN